MSIRSMYMAFSFQHSPRHSNTASSKAISQLQFAISVNRACTRHRAFPVDTDTYQLIFVARYFSIFF